MVRHLFFCVFVRGRTRVCAWYNVGQRQSHHSHAYGSPHSFIAENLTTSHTRLVRRLPNSA